jgi:hypothetical protein
LLAYGLPNIPPALSVLAVVLVADSNSRRWRHGDLAAEIGR